MNAVTAAKKVKKALVEAIIESGVFEAVKDGFALKSGKGVLALSVDTFWVKQGSFSRAGDVSIRLKFQGRKGNGVRGDVSDILGEKRSRFTLTDKVGKQPMAGQLLMLAEFWEEMVLDIKSTLDDFITFLTAEGIAAL